MSLFGFAFRANCVGLFAEAQRHHFELLLAFIAFIFVNRHTFIFLFSFNLEMKAQNVNTYEAIAAAK